MIWSNMDDVVRALAGTELFSVATPDELQAIVPAVRRRTFVRGACVSRAGDPADAAYVVLSGLFKVTTTGPDGHEVVVHLVGPGDTLGEYHLFDDTSRRYYDMVAVERSECLVLARASLQYHLERNPRLMRHLAAALLRKLLRQFDEVLSPRTERDIGGRLERQLAVLAGSHGEDTAAGRRILFRLNQSMLASLVGSSRENVNRALRRLVQDGAISNEGGQITLLESPGHGQEERCAT
jgi:CRP/FNR family transcriptional regulator